MPPDSAYDGTAVRHEDDGMRKLAILVFLAGIAPPASAGKPVATLMVNVEQERPMSLQQRQELQEVLHGSRARNPSDLQTVRRLRAIDCSRRPSSM